MIDLTGRTIVTQRLLSAAELDAEGWPKDAEIVALELNDGTLVYSMADCGGMAGLIGRDPNIAPRDQYFEVCPCDNS